MCDGEPMPSSGTSRDVEKAWRLFVSSADTTNLCMDSTDVAHAFCSPTTSRGWSHELSVDHISRAIEIDTDDVGKVLRGHRDGIGDITAKESAMQGGRPVDVEDDLGPCSESALWVQQLL